MFLVQGAIGPCGPVASMIHVAWRDAIGIESELLLLLLLGEDWIKSIVQRCDVGSKFAVAMDVC